MIRVLVIVFVIFALAAGFAWLADNPGTLSFSLRGYEISTTIMAAAIMVLLLLVIGLIVWLLLRAVFRAPRALSRQTAERRRDLGQQALARGFIAVAAGDTGLAAHYAAESQHYARTEPMTLMLNAQAAQLAGDTMGARAAYELMLARPETRILGLRGLFGEARRRGDAAAARSFAEEAVKEKPGISWAGNALLEYQAAEGEWAAALATLQSLIAAGTTDAPRGQRLKAVLLTARAGELEAGEPETARDLALEAHRLAADLVPAAVIAGRLSSRLGDTRKASRVLEAGWKIEPHPELANAYMNVRPGESSRDRLKRIRQLIKIRANHLEGQLALARAAIDAQDWATAREELRGVIATHPSERAFVMMAEIEEGEHADIGRARDWLGRAVRAPRDPAWMADGYVFDGWEPVSPISGRLDAFEWKAPVERMRADHPEEPPPAVTTGRAVAIVAAPPPHAAIVPAPALIDAAMDRDDDDIAGKVDATDLEMVAEEDDLPATEAGLEIDESRQPDDPGPDPEPEPPPPKDPQRGRRFRLFS